MKYECFTDSGVVWHGFDVITIARPTHAEAVQELVRRANAYDELLAYLAIPATTGSVAVVRAALLAKYEAPSTENKA